jgi:CheY-like chemotaxis protein
MRIAENYLLTGFPRGDSLEALATPMCFPMATEFHRPDQAALIYVVDDEPLVAEVLATSLELAGYRICRFTDSQAAWESFLTAREKPALLVADFQMPNLNGMELIERCKTAHPPLKTISASGTLRLADLPRFPVAPDHFIAKPFFPRELVELVRQLLAS